MNSSLGCNQNDKDITQFSAENLAEKTDGKNKHNE